MGHRNRGGCSDSTWPADPEIYKFGGVWGPGMALALGDRGSLQPQQDKSGKAHLRVSEAEVQSAVIRKKAKSCQEKPVLEKGPSPAESSENSPPLHGAPTFLPYPCVPDFPRSINGTKLSPKFFCDPFAFCVQDSCLRCLPTPSYFVPSKHFSHFPSGLRKTLGGKIPTPATFSPRHHLTAIPPGVMHTCPPHGGPRDHLVLGNSPNGPLPTLSRSVNSRLSAE